MKKVIIRGESYMMVNESYLGTSEFEIIFGSNPVLRGSFKKGKPQGMTAPVSGIFNAVDGSKFVVYVDGSANLIEDVDAKGYLI